MEKHIAEEAKKIINRIMDVEDKIKRLNEMCDWKLNLCTSRHSNGLRIPDSLQDTVFTLVKTSYENELNELRKELENL